MQPVGGDDEVEPLGRAVLERDIDPSVVGGERGDRVAEPQVDAARDELEQHPGEVAAEDLEVGDRALSAEHLDAEFGEGATAVVDVAHAPLGELRGTSREAAERMGLLEPIRAAQVDQLPARAQVGGELDDRHVVTAPREGVRCGQSGDAAAGDEHLHDSSSSRSPRLRLRSMVRVYETNV